MSVVTEQHVCADGIGRRLLDHPDLLREIIEHVTVAMVLVGPDLRWIYANPAFCALVGYGQDECVGMTVADIMHHEDLPQARADIEGMHQGRSSGFSKERRYVRRDGSVVWVTVNVTCLRRTEDDRPPCHLVQIVDIQGQKQASAALEAASRENTIYRAMIEALPDLIFAKDLESRFLGGNTATAKFMGAGDVGQLIGRTDHAFYPSEVARRLREDEEAFFTAGHTTVLEQLVTRKDGQRVVLQSIKSLLVDETGRTIGYVGHGKDVTLEKQREEALSDAYAQLRAQNEELQGARWTAERANLAKSQFLASMSHEIRTPMTSVLGMADLLALDELTPVQRRYLETIRKSGSHLLSIINDILDFSRIEAGRLELERIDFVPLDMLEQVHSLLMPQATERGLDLRIEAKTMPSLVVQGDPTRIRQILVNLTGNALKFTTQGEVVIGLVEGKAGKDQTRLHFEVRDTGIGIPEDRQADLFEAFVQADSSVSRQYGGSGLGLAICKRLVNAMGGSIGVASAAGQGSTFWFEVTLPLGDARALVRRERADRQGGAPLKVLVVDDVAVNRELLAEMLRRSGHQVEQAEDGAEAVAKADLGRFDVVLMDVQMPVMNGIEATGRIRALRPPNCDVPIFALTANVMESEQKRYLDAGMNACLTKPVIWDQLFDAMGRLIPGGPEPDAASAAPQRTASGHEEALLDQARIEGMASRMPPALFGQMLARGLDGAEESCRRLRAVLHDPLELAKEAHRLRGTAGTFGFARVSRLAGSLEERVERGQHDAEDLLAALEAAMHDSRHEASGWLVGRSDPVLP